MKATIYNISVEGTPEEIAQLKKLLDQQYNTYTNPYTYPNIQNPLKWCEVTCNSTANLNQ